MNSAADLAMLLSIPLLVSLNWLIGGNLIAHLPALPLAGARVLVGTVVLYFFSDIRGSQAAWSERQRRVWWKQQLLLSLTGRVGYYVIPTWSGSLIWPELLAPTG